jgi:hypothetical protein
MNGCRMFMSWPRSAYVQAEVHVATVYSNIYFTREGTSDATRLSTIGALRNFCDRRLERGDGHDGRDLGEATGATHWRSVIELLSTRLSACVVCGGGGRADRTPCVVWRMSSSREATVAQNTQYSRRHRRLARSRLKSYCISCRWRPDWAEWARGRLCRRCGVTEARLERDLERERDRLQRNRSGILTVVRCSLSYRSSNTASDWQLSAESAH